MGDRFYGQARGPGAKSGIELRGIPALSELFKEFPFTVVRAARKRGLRQAGGELRRLFRLDAPVDLDRGSGNLKRTIGVKWNRKFEFVTVGLVTPLQKNRKGQKVNKRDRRVAYYYKTLEYRMARGPLKPWMGQSWERHKHYIEQKLLEETELALFFESTKSYNKSLAALQKASK